MSLKKKSLSEKLKKLEQSEVVEAPPEDIDEAAKIKEVKEETEEAKPEVKAERAEVKYREEGVLKVKEPEKIKETKPQDIIETLDEEKYKKLLSIKDLAVPEARLSRLFKIETKYTAEELVQILTSWRDSRKIIKFTIKKDPTMQEFYAVINEGLTKLKEKPPVYGLEMNNGAIITSHLGDYTFIMGCRNIELMTLVKLFAYALENAKRYNLKA